ncbi:hypothetical protein V1318_13145 [Lysobacter sp. CCNWLW3]|uniref:hypothetical protein n=1 Tax=unclassified Lysobacter TaxID=2635362 RepID=UPI002FD74B10
MPAGILISNEHGTVLIDDTNFNIALAAKGIATPLGGGPPYLAHVSNSTAQLPVWAYRQSEVLSSMHARTYSAGVSTLLVGGSTPGAGDYHYYLFDKPAAPGGSTYGIQVFNASNELTFDSRLKHPVIAEVIVPTATGTFDTMMPAGREYAIATQGVLNRIVGDMVTIFAQPADIGRRILIIDVTGY